MCTDSGDRLSDIGVHLVPEELGRTINGVEIDLTRSQFRSDHVLGEPQIVSREYILADSFRNMLYQRFSTEVNMALNRG